MLHCQSDTTKSAIKSLPKALNPDSLVVLVGPPNSGKSTLFNRLTGLNQKVANYPGVTVEKKIGKANLDSGQQITLVDLPGIYSLEARSDDEKIAIIQEYFKNIMLTLGLDLNDDKKNSHIRINPTKKN